MKNPRKVVEQCDALIAKHEEAIREVRRLRRKALELIPIRTRSVEDAWGRVRKVRYREDEKDDI